MLSRSHLIARMYWRGNYVAVSAAMCTLPLIAHALSEEPEQTTAITPTQPSIPSPSPFSAQSGKERFKRMLVEPVILPQEMIDASLDRFDGISLAKSLLGGSHAVQSHIMADPEKLAAIHDAQVGAQNADVFMVNVTAELARPLSDRDPAIPGLLPLHVPYMKKTDVQSLVDSALREGPNGYIKPSVLLPLIAARSRGEMEDIKSKIVHLPQIAKEFWSSIFKNVTAKSDQDFRWYFNKEVEGTQHLFVPLSMLSKKQIEIVIDVLTKKDAAWHLQKMGLEAIPTSFLGGDNLLSLNQNNKLRGIFDSVRKDNPDFVGKFV